MILLTHHKPGNIMRKIEQDVLEAIANKTGMASGNTAVTVHDTGNIWIHLHGAAIVRIEDNEKNIFVSLAGWNTTVTRGRVNLIMNKYGVSRVYNKGNTPEIDGNPIKARGWYQVMRDGIEIPAEGQE
jgi:hypothetical protein